MTTQRHKFSIRQLIEDLSVGGVVFCSALFLLMLISSLWEPFGGDKEVLKNFLSTLLPLR